jgi:hypothetical protein
MSRTGPSLARSLHVDSQGQHLRRRRALAMTGHSTITTKTTRHFFQPPTQHTANRRPTNAYDNGLTLCCESKALQISGDFWLTALFRCSALWFLRRPILRRVQFVRQFGESVAASLTKLLFGQVLRRRKIRAADVGMRQIDSGQPRGYQTGTAQICVP